VLFDPELIDDSAAPPDVEIPAFLCRKPEHDVMG
jgi:hypothetical protein